MAETLSSDYTNAALMTPCITSRRDKNSSIFPFFFEDPDKYIPESKNNITEEKKNHFVQPLFPRQWLVAATECKKAGRKLVTTRLVRNIYTNCTI